MNEQQLQDHQAKLKKEHNQREGIEDEPANADQKDAASGAASATETQAETTTKDSGKSKKKK